MTLQPGASGYELASHALLCRLQACENAVKTSIERCYLCFDGVNLCLKPFHQREFECDLASLYHDSVRS